MNNYWSTYVQSSEELYKSRELLFHDGNKDLWLIEYAKLKSKESGIECKFVNGDAASLPFENNTFDLCFSHTVFDFCDPGIFLKEQIRVLKPGGKVAISTVSGGINAGNWKPDENSDEKVLFDKLWNEAFKNELSNIKRNGVELREYPEYLQNAGFTKVNVDTISVVPFSSVSVQNISYKAWKL